MPLYTLTPSNAKFSRAHAIDHPNDTARVFIYAITGDRSLILNGIKRPVPVIARLISVRQPLPSLQGEGSGVGSQDSVRTVPNEFLG